MTRRGTVDFSGIELERYMPKLIEIGMNVLGAIAVIIAGRIAANILGGLANRAMERGRIEVSLRGFLVSLLKVAVFTFAIISALAQFGVQTTSFVALIGAAGLAIGLALQGSLGNFASGVMILLFKPFKIGDVIETQGHRGTVAEIGIFTSTINTRDNQRVIMPNGSVMSGPIVNVNGNGTRRVELTIGISYTDDMEKAKKLAMTVCVAHPKVLKTPAPTVGVFEMGDSSVNLYIRPWTTTDDYWSVWCEVIQSVKESFDANGIEIPFPQRDVHMKTPAAV